MNEFGFSGDMLDEVEKKKLEEKPKEIEQQKTAPVKPKSKDAKKKD